MVLSEKQSIRLLAGAGCAVLLFLFLAVLTTGTAEGPNALTAKESGGTYSDASFSDVDRYHFIRLFRPRIYYQEGGATVTELKPIYPSPVGLEKSKPELYRLFMRGKELQEAFLRRAARDQKFSENVRTATTVVLSQLAPNTSQREGRLLLYPYFLSQGIYHQILEEAGPSVTVVLPKIASDPWGSYEKPFARGTALDQVASRYPASVLMFHYCVGMRSPNRSGPTISASESDPYLLAHRELYERDVTFRERYNSLMRGFEDKAAALDPFDLPGTARLTHDLREALIKAGIAEQIEKRAKANGIQ